MSGSCLSAGRYQRRQLQKRSLRDRYSVVRPLLPSVPFSQPSHARDGLQNSYTESGSTHTSAAPLMYSTDAEVYRVQGVPLDPLPLQDPEGHLHWQSYKDHSSFAPFQNGEPKICPAMYDQDTFCTQGRGDLPSLQPLSQRQDRRQTGRPPAQHLGTSFLVAALPGPPFPMIAPGNRLFDLGFDAERELYQGADGYHFKADLGAEASGGLPRLGSWSGHRAPSADHSMERVASLSGGSAAR